MFSYAVDHLLGYSRYLLLILLSFLLGCTPVAISEPTPMRLLNAELGLTKSQVNQFLLRRHRKGMDCSSNSANNGQVCVFTATEALPLSLSGRKLDEIRYHFADDQLIQITGHFAPNSKPDNYREAMKQRYGTPSKSSAQVLLWCNGTEQLLLRANSIQLERISTK